ncbi:hypothetical protein OG330_05480 [Streptomyces albidoflavus]|uniref:Uncharacterized protein n=2 Tax=Streptomyces TaxID=1883 RepID=D6BBC2_9ACTN|nr:MULTISPECIES: hypothetical protein [Streptomyces]SCD43827.1 hypothetical protein GA0115236_106914 [Streptomyces sp. IgraMP-1]BDH49956.1 hypothetical protein MTP02_09670 [Streptomyces albus]AGI87337.1 Secreted protein [Streptomyces albidoflavus]AMM07716.1 Secreted protein [Streptomyces albidoflavus]EFE84550.1 conserved hypothetical protein [Streptomyces albidoflavus]
MRAWHRHLALLASGAALCLAAVTPASGAEPGWVVGPVSPAAFTGQNEGNFVRLINNALPESCGRVSIAGSLASTQDPSTAVGTVATSTFHSPDRPCTTLLGNSHRTTKPGGKLKVEKYDAATGITTGRLDNYVEETLLGAMRWTTAGHVPWTYENGTGHLRLEASGNDLTIVASQNGGALLPVGAPVTLKGTLLLSIQGTNTPPTLTPQP